MAHIDVVDARREDWERDPFTLVEENGYFYARGSADDKAMAAVFLDLMIRLREENFRPRRTLKLALTCGEETSNRVNGIDYLEVIDRDLSESDPLRQRTLLVNCIRPLPAGLSRGNVRITGGLPSSPAATLR